MFLLFLNLFLAVFWLCSALGAINKKNFGKACYCAIFLFFAAISIAIGMQDFKLQRAFKNLRLGQTYTITATDNPFKAETITIIDLAENKKNSWVQYVTAKGDTIATKIDKFLEAIK